MVYVFVFVDRFQHLEIIYLVARSPPDILGFYLDIYMYHICIFYWKHKVFYSSPNGQQLFFRSISIRKKLCGFT